MANASSSVLDNGENYLGAEQEGKSLTSQSSYAFSMNHSEPMEYGYSFESDDARSQSTDGEEKLNDKTGNYFVFFLLAFCALHEM